MIPQIETECQARAICIVMGLELADHRPRFELGNAFTKGWVIYENDIAIAEDYWPVEVTQGVLNQRYRKLTPSQQQTIRAICRGGRDEA